MPEHDGDNQQSVLLLSGNQAPVTGVFTLQTTDGGCTLSLEFPGKRLAATKSDYFEALCAIRRELEQDGITPNCYGACRDCYPSGMGRDMGLGLRIYRLEIGRPAGIKDLVSLFAAGPEMDLTTVAEQERFWREWLADRRAAANR